jgi:hypothetical protein
MATTMRLIAKNVLGSDTASVTFSDIPGTFTDLLIAVSARSTQASANTTDLYAQFNGATTNYSMRRLYGTGSAVASDTASGSSTSLRVGNMTATSSTADTFGNAHIYIPNYAGSTNKSVSAESCSENNGTEALVMAFASLWSNTAAITSILLAPLSGSFKSGSSFFLYGITKA